MKIALIDTGIREEICNGYEVKHYSLSDKGLVNKYQNPVESHGTECFKEIIAGAGNKKIQILDLNILKEGGSLEIANIIVAIEKAIEEQVDIINISLGVKIFSQELYHACEMAVYNNVVIAAAASHTNTLSFPADFDNVICVRVNQSQLEKIKVEDSMTVSIPMKDYIIEDKGTFDFSSSSLACARFVGYLCDELEGSPLNDKYKILSHKYGITVYGGRNDNNSEILEENKFSNIIRNNKVAVVVFPFDRLKIEDIQYLHKNIVAYFDHKKCGFYSLDGKVPVEDFDIILILNTSYNDMEVPIDIQKQYKKYKVICIGNFLNADGGAVLQQYESYNASELSVLDRPVIAIAGLSSGVNKWDVQCSLLKSLEEDGLDIGSISNNPAGLLYEMNVFNYPKELKFPNIVYSINRFMYLYEINKNIDAWLINIGGGIDRINSLNTYNFGKLVDAYLSAANVDVLVMCVNPSIDVNFLKLLLSYIYKYGVEKIFLVLSHNDINAATMDYKDGLQTYYIDEEKYNTSLEYIKNNMKEMVFSLDDVKNNVLYRHIIEALS